MSKDEIADQIAHSAFQGLGFEMTTESLNQSCIAIGWSIGIPKPKGGWSDIDIHYHYEEALALRFLAMEAQALTGYISKLMELTEKELGVPVSESGLVPLDVLRGMTRWSLAHAKHRASVAGSTGNLSPDEAMKIFDSRVQCYEELIDASVKNTEPIPIRDFQLGLSREHPWTAVICYMSDNMCETLNFGIDDPESLILQIAISTKRDAFYQSVLKNLPEPMS